MKATELQIGDWVFIKDYPIKALPQKVKPEHFVRSLVEFEPIPLEKIHLTKNGFEAREETDDTEFYYYDSYEINVSFDEGISEENIPPIIFLTIEFAEKSIAMPIEYVHELQQAMRIMGCDKEIEL